jgi:hypothetical protein
MFGTTTRPIIRLNHGDGFGTPAGHEVVTVRVFGRPASSRVMLVEDNDFWASFIGNQNWTRNFAPRF